MIDELCEGVFQKVGLLGAVTVITAGLRDVVIEIIWGIPTPGGTAPVSWLCFIPGKETTCPENDLAQGPP
jgi:hypothetical protein